MRSFAARLLLAAGALWTAFSGICAVLDARRMHDNVDLLGLLARTVLLVGVGCMAWLAGKSLGSSEEG